MCVIERMFEGRTFYFYEITHIGWCADKDKALRYSEREAGNLTVWLRRHGRQCKVTNF